MLKFFIIAIVGNTLNDECINSWDLFWEIFTSLLRHASGCCKVSALVSTVIIPLYILINTLLSCERSQSSSQLTAPLHNCTNNLQYTHKTILWKSFQKMFYLLINILTISDLGRCLVIHPWVVS